VLAVKDNQPTLAKDVKKAFATAQIGQEELPDKWRFETSEKGHGRKELRRTTVLDIKGRLGDKQQDWLGLRSIISIESERSVGEKTSAETRYYISSLEPDAELLAKRIRAHWAIENELHWTLDMAFDEDHSRIRCNNGAENFALLRKIALNLIKAEKSAKQSVRVKRKRAGWDDTYLLRVLQSNVSDPPPPTQAT
jgi:predicted transposase YbfD/YdcC